MKSLWNYRLLVAVVLALTCLDSGLAIAVPPQKQPEPYQVEFNCDSVEGTYGCTAYPQLILTDMHLVVEYVSAQVSLPTGQKPIVFLTGSWPSDNLSVFLPILTEFQMSGTITIGDQENNVDKYISSQPVKAYFTELFVNLSRSDNTGDAVLDGMIIGRLEQK